MKTKTNAIFQRVILLFIVILINIPLLFTALLGLWANDRLEKETPPELTEGLKVAHLKRIQSNDPELLRDHVRNIWDCFESTEEERLWLIHLGNQFYKIVYNLMLMELFLFVLYYILRGIETKKPPSRAT